MEFSTINNADAVAKYAAEIVGCYRNGVNGTPAPQLTPVSRQRKRSLASTLRAARKAGADRAVVDGVVIALSPSAAVPVSDANEWDAVLSEADHESH